MTQTTLGAVADRVAAMAKNHRDELVPVDDIGFDGVGTMLIAGEPHPMGDVAQSAVASRLGIPLQYLKKCPEDVQTFNLDHWIRKERNDKLFIRFDAERVRAVFTPRYVPVDNGEVIDRLMSMGLKPDLPVWCRLDEDFMHISASDAAKSFTIKGKDRVDPGVSVANSEVGLSSLTVSAFYMRLVCTNGMVSQTEVGASYRHLSRRIIDEFPQVLQGVGQAIEAKMGQFRLSLESSVNDPASTMRSFNKRYLLNPVETEAAAWGFLQEEGNSMFHVVNAYTKGAQYPGIPVESSYRLEKVGGDILSLVR